MTGRIGLHGGGEYLRGRRAVPRCAARGAARAVGRRAEADGRFDVTSHGVVVPDAPAGVGAGRDRRPASNGPPTGVAAFERRGDRGSAISARVEVVRVVDDASAADAELAAERSRRPISSTCPVAIPT